MIEPEAWKAIRKVKVNITYFNVSQQINLNDLREIVVALLKYSNTHYNPEYPKTIATKIQRVIDETALSIMESSFTEKLQSETEKPKDKKPKDEKPKDEKPKDEKPKDEKPKDEKPKK